MEWLNESEILCVQPVKSNQMKMVIKNLGKKKLFKNKKNKSCSKFPGITRKFSKMIFEFWPPPNKKNGGWKKRFGQK